MRIFPLLICCASIWALPKDPIVTAGSAKLNQFETNLQITADDRTIINWNDFSIDSGEWANFILPNEKAMVLNRVLSDIPSQVMGNLTSNGQVLLINPNGILIGKEARIDLGSFIATTLDVCDAAFIAKGDLTFKGSFSDAVVQNLGSINALDGDVLLIGWNVDNQGTLEAPNGLAAALSAGHVLIRPEGTEKIYIKPTSISEDSYSSAFNHNALDDALEIEEMNGTVVLKGSIRAKDVLVLGDRINASDLSIDAPSGKVYIGGGDKGENRNYSNAKHVYIGSTVSINADAIDEGPGGRVVIWSDDHTHFLGNITARGGMRGGDGGWAEVSGHYLDFQGTASLSAPNGQSGTLLLDPLTIVVSAGVAGAFSAPGACTGCGNAFVNCSTNTVSALGATTINGILAGGTNVILDATQAGAGAGTITFNAGANIAWATTANLTLNALGNVSINASIQNSTAGAFVAGQSSIFIQTQGGTVSINTGAVTAVGSQNGLTQICAPNADLILRSSPNFGGNAQVGFFVADGVATTCNGPINITCRNLTINGSNSTLNVSSQIGHGGFVLSTATSFSTTATSTIDVAAGGNILMFSAAGANGATQRSKAKIGHGKETLALPSNLSGALTVTAGGSITMSARTSIAINRVGVQIGHGGVSDGIYTIDYPLFVQAGGDLTIQYVPGFTNAGSSFIGIGSGSLNLNTAPGGRNDITVISGGNLLIYGKDTPIATGNLCYAHIGWSTRNTIAAVTIVGNISVSACSLTMEVNDSSATPLPPPAIFGIGYVNELGKLATVTGDVEIAIGGNILFEANGEGTGHIGNSAGPGSVSNTSVAAGGNMTIQGIQRMGIRGFGDVNVAAGGNVNLTANGVTNPIGYSFVYLGTEDTSNAVNPRTTRVFAGGNVIATNNAINPAFIGRGLAASSDAPSVTAFTTSLDIRAGGNINLAQAFTTKATNVAKTTFSVSPTSGLIYLEADTMLPAGALWVSAGAITSICQITQTVQTPPAAADLTVPILFLATACNQNLVTSSTKIDNNVLGGLQFDTGGFTGTDSVTGANLNFVKLNTSLAAVDGGSITLHSAPMGSGTSNLTLGTNANNANLITTNGNIEIWGSQNDTSTCIRGDSYNNITISQAIATSGSVFISANNSITINANGSINTPSFVTLIVDNQLPFMPFFGPGQFIMINGSFINGNIVKIYTSLQNQNSINGLINGKTFARGTLFTDTATEVWCTYWCAVLGGVPFTVSYKNCLGPLAHQANIVVSELGLNLHPYNEFPGWMERFLFSYAVTKQNDNLSTEPFYIRRRHLNLFNNPKTYTIIELD